MFQLDLPEYDDLLTLPTDELRRIMHLSSVGTEYEVESSILRLFAWAVANNGSDLHFNGKMTANNLDLYCNIRARGEFANWHFKGSKPEHFKEKIFNLCCVSSAGRANIISTRFDMSFPNDWAIKHGLKPAPGQRYFMDVRVQFQETHSGFTFVCRLLDPQKAKRLHEMGLSDSLLLSIKKAINEPSGLILASGPTGSGKTTLLNAILHELNDGTRSIFTIENPVEFTLRGPQAVTQIPVDGKVTFAEGLRAALRSDPDVILVGEIRDNETMEVALQAAQTGHLVVSTIHANGACETVSRVLDLCEDKERDAFRVADTLKFVMAQRLIGTYDNTEAPTERPVTLNEKNWIEDNGLVAPETIFETNSTSKNGRMALIEAVSIDYDIMCEITKPQLSIEKIFSLASQQLQYETLLMAGMRGVEKGLCRLSDCHTSLEGNNYAKVNVPLRTRLMRDHKIGYNQVADAIDQYCNQVEAEDKLTIDQIITQRYAAPVTPAPLTPAPAASIPVRPAVVTSRNEQYESSNILPRVAFG